MVVGKEPKTAIPISPEHFDRAIASRVVSKGRRRPNVGGLGKQSEGFRQELGGSIRVQGGERSERKDDPVKEWLVAARSLPLGSEARLQPHSVRLGLSGQAPRSLL